ncbi:MAG: TetR family transcriptional regulator [Acidobacteria bacterium]|nr:TetR family transcriptional regulator [Acidobacteriota bacterium]
MSDTRPRDSRKALLDAAEQLLIAKGHAAITVRSVATQAGVNHGLVRYYFQTLDNLLLEAFDRFSHELFERQRILYAEDRPFIEKWRSAMGYIEIEDRKSGYSKLWLEMQAMAWNRPDLQTRLQDVNRQWRTILTNAFTDAMDDYGIDTNQFPVEAVVSLVLTFNLGLQVEAIGGTTDGHAALLAMIDGWLQSLEADRPTGDR